jgi:alpha-galactosidase
MPIRADQHGWVLETKNTGYALGVRDNILLHRYWGARLPLPDDYPPPPPIEGRSSFETSSHYNPEEYPGYQGLNFTEPCLKVTFADGVRDTRLICKSVEISSSAAEETKSLEIELVDADYPLHVRLHYYVHSDNDLIGRDVSIYNGGDAVISVERAFSAQWHLPQRTPNPSYRLSHLTGMWFGESQIRREPLTYGTKVLESRRITTSHHHNPWFAVDLGNADEDQGEVWFGTLAWSGNWKLIGEVTDFHTTRINIGVNDWDFAQTLHPGKVFVTPPAYAGYTREGFGGASRRFHQFIRDQVVPHPEATRKVLYNSWEATLFDVDVESQGQLAEIAAAMGVELFVMDDGWFKGRVTDNAGLGDWTPDPVKFPNGLKPLIDRVNSLGMEFGLWIEPEMVNRDSDLYRAHPDWVIHFPTRPRSEARQQMILNLARVDVQEYLIGILDKLLSENNIAFIKWDMNRNVSEPGNADESGGRELWVRYVQGVYNVWGTLAAKHPHVIWQSCSGGGGRADLGILRYADQIWVSDNTHAVSRLGIQEGFSQLFPANTMEAWVTDVDAQRLPLSFRFHVSMCGVLGIGGHLSRWTHEEREEAAKWIALYKEIRPIIHNGNQYRLISASNGAFAAVQYMDQSADQGVLFAFRTYVGEPIPQPRIYLRGLIPDARYEIEGVIAGVSGQALMSHGISVPLANFESTVRRIHRMV